MDSNSIIDKTNFSVYLNSEDYPNAFICDKRIANIVAKLNKKGYETYASCGGHYNGGYSEQQDVDIEFLESIKDNKSYIIKEVRTNTFDCYIENTRARIYILFTDVYDFKDLPPCFNISYDEYNNKKRCCLESLVEYYTDELVKKEE